jgi:hypothetical protein
LLQSRDLLFYQVLGHPGVWHTGKNNRKHAGRFFGGAGRTQPWSTLCMRARNDPLNWGDGSGAVICYA